VAIFSSRRLFGARWVQKTIGVVGAEYLRFVWKTSRITLDPPDVYEQAEHDLPIIIGMWHGQHFLAPFIKRRPHHLSKVLISRHRDGEVNAIAAEWLGIPAIRGSGTHGGDIVRKGGISAFTEMLAALEEGYSIALTADVPKVSRVCGLGIVKLASQSGRAIYPVAIATHRRIVMNNWDRSTINLPFSRGSLVATGPIRVPRDADAATLEAARQSVENALNAATALAYEIADGKHGVTGRG
jgi:lysophospholipid acyltransferase (LPLAT)-like uncharacterized protein